MVANSLIANSSDKMQRRTFIDMCKKINRIKTLKFFDFENDDPNLPETFESKCNKRVKYNKTVLKQLF